jgi:hypothetical protein
MWVIVAAFLFMCSICSPAAASELVLSSGGKTQASIVVSPDATLSEQTAAKELADNLKQITGADFQVVDSASDSPTSKHIYIGQTMLVKEMLPDVDFSRLKRDTIIIRRVGDDLVLSGDRPRGSLYAVYTFLENAVGCRWWTPSASHIPRKSTLRVNIKDQIYAPPFIYREAFYNQVINRNPEFSAKLKLDGHFQPIKPDYGGHYSIIGWCHTYYKLIPPSKYFIDHPEWFSEIDGKRVSKGAQLCLSNQELQKEVARNAIERIRKNPAAGMISISQNDTNGPCQCANCRAIVQQEGAESGPVIMFANAVAEEIEKQYPNFLVETLAYRYTLRAPAHIRPRRNVIVRLCTMGANFAKPLDDPANAAFCGILKDWQAIAPQLYVWDYTAGFANFMLPHPNFRSLAPNIRLFARSNVIGLFEQGDGFNPDADFAALKTWYMAHLMWNPKQDESKLMDQFLDGYYGAAGQYLRQYIDLICDSVAAKRQRLPWDNDDYGFLSPEVLSQAVALFDAAEKAVGNDQELLRRVRLQRSAVDLAAVTNLPPSPDLKPALDRFLAVSDESGNFTKYEGSGLLPSYRDELKAKVSEPRK